MRINKKLGRVTLSKEETRVWFAHRLIESQWGTSRDRENIEVSRKLHRLALDAAKAVLRERKQGRGPVLIVATDARGDHPRLQSVESIHPDSLGVVYPDAFDYVSYHGWSDL